MAIIFKKDVNKTPCYFWKITKVEDDPISKRVSFSVDVYCTEFSDTPTGTLNYSYKGDSYFIAPMSTENDKTKTCYNKLKEELGGGYDYWTEGEDWCPKISRLVKNKNNKHFHDIDYTLELNTVLHRTEYFGEKGLLTKVEYYGDLDKTDKVLEFNRTYIHNPVQGVTHKHTKRTYYNVDGTVNSSISDKGLYKYTENQSRKATLRRRENIIFNIEKVIIQVIIDESPDQDLNSNMILASEFVSEISTSKNNFISSGNPTSLLTKIATSTNYPFLTWEVSEGVSVEQFINSEVIY
jgi:hypothetical protein